MLNWLSRLSDPFVAAPVVRPPGRMLDFYRYFIRPVRGLLYAIVAVSLVASLSELALFVFLGRPFDICILNPKDKRPFFLTRKEPVKQRRPGVPDMEKPSGAWGKSDSDFFHQAHISIDKKGSQAVNRVSRMESVPLKACLIQ